MYETVAFLVTGLVAAAVFKWVRSRPTGMFTSVVAAFVVALISLFLLALFGPQDRAIAERLRCEGLSSAQDRYDCMKTLMAGIDHGYYDDAPSVIENKRRP